ncbi:glutaredoxin family protein [Allohahella marinimesophila]|uniref:Glutaredoxin family protein n=1 Tax=Allohahella marinimesophila TaxID=1054972 RepID=A0ABP7NZG8_9GAMM
MKKLCFLVLAIVVYQHWDTVQELLRPPPAMAADPGEVILYATSWCSYCAQTRHLLDREGVEYLEYDIETSAEGLEKFKALGGRGVPVLQVDNSVVYGYSERKMKALLFQ